MRPQIQRLLSLLTAAAMLSPAPLPAWGDKGHAMSGRLAATSLPDPMPSFFRDSRDQLEYLNPEPDRWRNNSLTEMNEAFRYDHYLDLEAVNPPSILHARDRFEFLEALIRFGIREPEVKVGLLPFHIIELYQRLQNGFSIWRKTTDPAIRNFVQQRIINDAGLLGHYVTDGANPHHATVHFNGWDTSYPNPQNFPADRTFHGRFENEFVVARVEPADLGSFPAPRLLDNPRQEVIAYLQESNKLVIPLYELDRTLAFNKSNTSADHKQFAIARLRAGISMLRDLWWTAWSKSAT
jgi:hypothetical protein